MTISERIKQRRKELGISQQELAERAGFSSGSAINKIELGHRDISVSRLSTLAEALDVSPFWLLGQEPRTKSRFEEVWDLLTPAQHSEALQFISFILWRDQNAVTREVDNIYNQIANFRND